MSNLVLYNNINNIYLQYNDNNDRLEKNYIETLYKLLNIKFILDDKSIIDKHIYELKKNYYTNIRNNEKLLDIMLDNSITLSYQL